jgi:hypothetical protein
MRRANDGRRPSVIRLDSRHAPDWVPQWWWCCPVCEEDGPTESHREALAIALAHGERHWPWHL